MKLSVNCHTSKCNQCQLPSRNKLYIHYTGLASIILVKGKVKFRMILIVVIEEMVTSYYYFKLFTLFYYITSHSFMKYIVCLYSSRTVFICILLYAFLFEITSRTEVHHYILRIFLFPQL